MRKNIKEFFLKAFARIKMKRIEELEILL